MADGNVFELVRGVLDGMDRFLDYVFYAGVFYGSRNFARLVFRTCSGLRTYFVPFGRASDEDMSKKYGKWAVITGGTTGIGLAYAHEFARRRINVVLISRSYDDLVNIISQLQSQYNVQTYGIYADFSLGAKVYQDVEDTLKDLEVGILVNNVSVRYDHPQYFALVPHERVWQIVNINISMVTMMSHMLLPQMLERGKGAIINVCSVAACTPPIPLTAEYTASIAYVDRFSQTLHQENKHKGICVQTLLPCFVAQSGVRATLPTLFSPSPETYVRHAIATLGINSRVSGYWPHALQGWLCSLIPEWLWVWFTRYFNATTRRRCLSEREAAGTPRFSRRRGYAPAPSVVVGEGTMKRHGPSNGKRSPISNEHSLRRTPSPHDQRGRIHADSGGSESAASPAIQHRVRTSYSATPDTKRKISLEEITRSRSSSTGSAPAIPPPIREDSTSSLNSALSTPDITTHWSPRFDRAFTPPSSLPRRSSTLDPPARRLSACKRTSRVLVMPSVAMVSYSPEPHNINSNS